MFWPVIIFPIVGIMCIKLPYVSNFGCHRSLLHKLDVVVLFQYSFITVVNAFSKLKMLWKVYFSSFFCDPTSSDSTIWHRIHRINFQPRHFDKNNKMLHFRARDDGIFEPKLLDVLKKSPLNCKYRPPNSTVELFSAYEKLIKKLDSENKETILIGDFNCDWTGIKSGTMKPQTNKLHEITEAFQFEQMIEQPTRITEHSETIIDLVFTNKPELVTNVGVIHVGISDHSLIFLQRKICVPRSEPKLIKKGILNIIMLMISDLFGSRPSKFNINHSRS